MATKPTPVRDYKFQASKDGQALLMQFKANGKTAEYSLPMSTIAGWIGKQIEQVGKVGKTLPAPPDGMPREIPWEAVSMHRPLRVAVSYQRKNPVITMDFGAAVFGFEIRRDILAHMFKTLLEKFPE
jgi:hypothetical protein